MTARLAAAAVALWALVGAALAEPPRLLYFTMSAGYRHDVLPLSARILAEVGERSEEFSVTESEDVGVFTPERLGRYAGVAFFTSGELPLDAAQKALLLAYIREGHGFVGIHSATDTFYLWPEWLDLVGATFNNHPWHQKVTVRVANPESPITAFLGRAFAIDDEIYQVSDFDHRGSHVLLRLDPASVDLAAQGVHPRFYGWPLAWTRSYGQGRSFYVALGHEEGVWRDPRYQRLLQNGIAWALGRR